MNRRTIDLDRPAVAWAAYAVVAGLVCFWRLGSLGLLQMEGIVADGGRTMLETGRWIVPRVFGEVYTFKPSMAYWLSAAAQTVADPRSSFWLRLPAAISGFGLGAIVMALVARIAGLRRGWTAGIACVTGILFIQKVHLAEFDVLLASGVGVATAAACVNLARASPSAGLWWLAYAGLTFGFLSKGLPALACFGPGLVVAATVLGKFRQLLRPGHLAALASFLVLTGGYLWAAERDAGPVVFEQPLLEAGIRGFGWGVRQEGPVLSKLADAEVAEDVEAISTDPEEAVLRTLLKPLLILVAFLPWSAAAAFGLRGAVPGSGAPAVRALGRGARAFFVTGIVVFMLIPTHEMRYYLPLAASVAILAGLVVGGPPLPIRSRRWLAWTASTVCVLAAIGAAAGGFESDADSVTTAVRLLLVVVGILATGFAVRALRRPVRGNSLAVLLVGALTLLCAENLAFRQHRGERRDLSRQAEQLGAALPAGETVWVLGPADLAGKSSALLYLLDRPVRTFRSAGAGAVVDGGWCLLSSDRPDPRSVLAGFEFEEVSSAEDPWRRYSLGRCSWRAADRPDHPARASDP